MKRSRNGQGPGLGLSRKGKQLIGKNPRLFTISEKERQLLLSDRVANILENSYKLEDYDVYLSSEKVDFPTLPQRLLQYREKDSPLWKRASSPFHEDKKDEYLRKLEESNRIKTLHVLPAKTAVHNQTVTQELESFSVDDEDKDDVETPTRPSFLESPDPTSDSNSNDTKPTEEFLGSLTKPQPDSYKRLFPVFAALQRKSLSTPVSASQPIGVGTMNTTLNNSDCDFETPKPVKSRFHLWGSKRDESKTVLKSAYFSNSTDSKPPSADKSNHKDLAHDLLTLFLEKANADLTIYGREEKPIRAHKLILQARCPKLLKDVVMDNNSNSERKRDIIPLTCFSHKAVKAMLCYIYSGKILPPGFRIECLKQKELDEIIELGQKYGLDLTPPSPLGSNNDDIKIIIPRQNSAVQTIAPECEEKSIQTDELEIEREELLNDVRMDERSFPYLNKSPINFDDHTGSMSPDLFEDSFNDKVYAHKLNGGDASFRKRRKTSCASEKSLNGNCSNNKISGDSDSDCIILDDDEDNDNQKNSSLSNGSINDRNKSNNLASSSQTKANNFSYTNGTKINISTVDSECTTPKRTLSLSPRRNNNSLFPPAESTPCWNKNCDDTFFANLPADEELLNMPPTSPFGYDRFSPELPDIHSPPSPLRSRDRHSPISRLEILESPKYKKKGYGAGSKKQGVRRKSDEVPPKKLVKKGRKKGGGSTTDTSKKSSNVDDAHFQFDSDEDDQFRQISSQGEPRRRVTTSQTRMSSSQSALTGNQTPMLNYSCIDTPLLKKELKRYGLKPLPRSKAKILLRHIYHETHKNPQ